jgi:hypothetical protein
MVGTELLIEDGAGENLNIAGLGIGVSQSLTRLAFYLGF